MNDKRHKLEQDLEMWRAKHDPIGEGQTLANLAYLDILSGDMSLARSRYDQAATLLEGAGDKESLAALCHERANLEWKSGNLSAALTFYKQSLQLARETGNRQVEAAVIHGLGMLEYQEGDYDAARKTFEESLRLKQTLDDQPNTAATQVMLGQILFNDAVRSHGDRQSALDMIEEAITTYQDLIMPNEALAAMRILTDLQRMDDVLRAEQVSGVGDQGSDSEGDKSTTYDKLH